MIGARPQFIKAAPVSRALRERHEEIMIHSGQHFDFEMNDVFFSELGLPAPDVNLGVHGGGHGRMTGEMLIMLEERIADYRPDWVLVYGDTNTTLAGGLAAAKLNIPVAHIEAGLRSFNREMPEEINRIVVDHISTLLLCPTEEAVSNLRAEGIESGVELVGDVMLDTARLFAERIDAARVVERHGLRPQEYYLATLHRQATVDDPFRLRQVVEVFLQLDLPVVWPLHPRTRRNLERFDLKGVLDKSEVVKIKEPLPYGELNALLRCARKVLTDSGGMQKEAYFFSVPCLTLREETEWVETLSEGWNVLVGTDKERILGAIHSLPPSTPTRPELYGDGHAAERCVRFLERPQ